MPSRAADFKSAVSASSTIIPRPSHISTIPPSASPGTLACLLRKPDNEDRMLLPRGRLTALLSEQALTSVELVIAPPGYGKTTVLRDYAAGDSEAVFVALPEATDLETFVRAIVEEAAPSARRSVGGVFDGRTGAELEEHAGQWLVSRLRAFSGTLIVDDFHRAAGDERVARVLTAAIAATYGRMRWVIASREAPRFPMGSWIARGWMGLPVSGDDLRFNAAEAAELAASLGIEATAADIAAIVADTLGWPIGVRLALGLISRGRVAGQTRMQTRDALFALIDDEIWQPLEGPLRDFIAAAALVPSPAVSTLAASGFPAARALATDAFARVPFVQQIDGDAFAIHDLFREFVSVRATPRGAGGDVKSQLGSALVSEGNVADGLRVMISGRQTDQIEATLAMHAFDLLETGHRTTVSAALAYLTEQGRGDEGVSLAVNAALALADGSSSNAIHLYARALDRTLPPGMRGEAGRRLALTFINRGTLDEAAQVVAIISSSPADSPSDSIETLVLQAMLASRAGLSERVCAMTMIDDIENRLAEAQPRAQVRTLQRLGNAALLVGDVERAERFSLDAALLATNLGMETYASMSYAALYAIAGIVDTNTKRARSFLRSQQAAAERAGNTALRVLGLRGEFSIYAMNGERAAAATAEETLSQFADARAFRDMFTFRYSRAMNLVANGEFARAESVMKTIPASSLNTSERGIKDALLIILDLLQDRRTPALRALDRGFLADASSDFWSTVEMSHAYALRGLGFWSLDRPAQARKAFEIEVDLLPQRDRILVDALKHVTELQHPLISNSDIDAMCLALDNADFAAYSIMLRALVRKDANDVELSATEIETLRIFDRVGGRAADVAEILGKSKFTIQNQIQSAIRKLGCSGRAEALAYARKRGWLDKTS